MKKDLRNKVKIGTVNDRTLRDDNDQKSEVLNFYTRRDENCDVKFRMRVVVELTDKQGQTYFAGLTEGHKGAGDLFTGEEKWEFKIPHGELEKPKLTAYAIQSGFLHNGEFVPIAEDLDDVDSAEEIKDRTTTRIDMKCTYHHAEFYTD